MEECCRIDGCKKPLSSEHSVQGYNNCAFHGSLLSPVTWNVRTCRYIYNLHKPSFKYLCAGYAYALKCEEECKDQ